MRKTLFACTVSKSHPYGPTDELLAAIDVAGLKVVGKVDVRPHHPKASDVADPLHAARAAEITSLWRLAAR